MITVFIAQDEERIKKMLVEMLRKEGRGNFDGINPDKALKIINKDDLSGMVSLEDKVIELGNSLYREKQGLVYKTVLEIIERPLIEHILERTEGNQLKAARILGINRNTMRAKIKKLGIKVDKWKIDS